MDFLHAFMGHVSQAGTATRTIYSVEFVVLKCVIAQYNTIYQLYKTIITWLH